MTKAEKIVAICEAIENWDQETLLDMAKEWRAQLLAKESAKTIDILYNHEVAKDVYSS